MEVFNDSVEIKNKKKGLLYELHVGKHYEKMPTVHKIQYRGLEFGVNDGGVDLIVQFSNKKSTNYVFIQCKNWSVDTEYNINDKIIKGFLYDCILLSTTHDAYENSSAYYMTPHEDLYSFSSLAVLKEHEASKLNLTCKAKILKMEENSTVENLKKSIF